MLLVACSESPDNSAEEPTQTQETAVDDSRISLADVGMPLTFEIHDRIKDFGDVHMKYNDIVGQAEIQIGDNLAFTVAREKVDLQTFKKDLQSEGVLEFVFFDSSNDALFYQSNLPTGRLVSHHYVRSLSVNGEEYLIKSNDDIVYNLFEAKELSKVINSLSGV